MLTLSVQVEAGVQTLPVISTDTVSTTILPAPAVEKAEFGVQVDPVAPAARVLVERSVQVTEPPRQFVDASTQFVDAATQFVHPICRCFHPNCRCCHPNCPPNSSNPTRF
jgi:hypothetical protein